ncbi:hypothetical protein C8F01DRAFT_1174324 [Mycena amicta]|nr:hypothetical protein C8F01DRAFT_1174324 [Mycena amicta]
MLPHPTVVVPRHRPIVTESYAKSAPNVKLCEISAQRHGPLLHPSAAQRQVLKFSAATTVSAAHDALCRSRTQDHHVYLLVVTHLTAIVISLLVHTVDRLVLTAATVFLGGWPLRVVGVV